MVGSVTPLRMHNQDFDDEFGNSDEEFKKQMFINNSLYRKSELPF